MADANRLEEDQLVARLVPDPAQGPPDAIMLRGYLGRGAKDGHWRLYVRAALDEYVELPEAEILHSQKLPDEQGTIVWVSKSLKLHHVHVQSTEVQAGFLGGAIAQSRIQSGSGAALTPDQWEVQQTSFAVNCSMATCPSFSVDCISQEACRSLVCETFICASHEVCPSVTVCPSHHLGCPTYTIRCTIGQSVFVHQCPPLAPHSRVPALCTVLERKLFPDKDPGPIGGGSAAGPGAERE